MPASALLPVLGPFAQSGGGSQPGEIVVQLQGCEDTQSAICDLVLDLTGSQTAADAALLLIGKPLRIALILAIAWLLTRLARRGGRRVADWVVSGAGRKAATAGEEVSAEAQARLEERAETIRRAARSVAVALIWTIATLLILAELGVNLFPLLAAVGVVGLAVGLGAQSLVRDYFTGVFLLVENQFSIGDDVDLGEATGVVEDLNLRTTTVRDSEGILWYVPNGEIGRVANRSQFGARALVDLRVPPDADIARVKTIVGDATSALGLEPEWSESLLDDPGEPYVQDLSADAILIRVSLPVRRDRKRVVERELRERLKNALDDAGIEQQLPQQIVYVRSAGA